MIDDDRPSEKPKKLNRKVVKKKTFPIDEEFLTKYLNGNSPTGFEYELGGQKIWMDKINRYTDDVKLDNYGTAYGVMGNKDSDYKVVIEAHCDEISWMVNYIDSSGYIKVIKNGGSDAQIAPSMRVTLWGNKGPIDGFFGHPAIHISYRPKDFDDKDIFVDIGASSKSEVLSMGINIGTVITYKDGFMKLNNKFYTGRALDNKIGGFIIAEVARLIKENNIELPYKLFIVNSVQEETGLKGAQMIADTIKPDVAIITDVCHDTTSPIYKPSRSGLQVAGQGPVISVAPAVHNKLRELIMKSGTKNFIPFQLKASSRSTGTDTESFAYSNGGTPSALISIPLKYMHTTVETCRRLDVKNTIKLIYNSLLDIKENHNFKYNK